MAKQIYKKFAITDHSEYVKHVNNKNFNVINFPQPDTKKDIIINDDIIPAKTIKNNNNIINRINYKSNNIFEHYKHIHSNNDLTCLKYT